LIKELQDITLQCSQFQQLTLRWVDVTKDLQFEYQDSLAIWSQRVKLVSQNAKLKCEKIPLLLNVCYDNFVHSYVTDNLVLI
jgi:hypothetical protein